jgi:hypothetical protein
MPLQQTSGNVTADAYGGGTAVEPVYIEQIFSTWLYAGTGSTQTITNGIDLSTKGGLVWLKNRDGTPANNNHNLVDTIRGISAPIYTNTNGAQLSQSTIASFNTTGFSMGAFGPNAGGTNYASWTFRKQPKFFDVVTYTGTGANRTIAHALGSVPGCIIVKRTDTTGDWQVYHSSLANTQYMVLNTTAAVATGATRWNSTTPTSSVFSVGTDATVNASGGTYVAYVFASNAGGFGLTGTDNVISCGSFTTDGSGNATVNLGYEPQWVLTRTTNGPSNWVIVDNMRGFTANGVDQMLQPNNSGAEAEISPYLSLTSTGFTASTFFGTSAPNIYIAIRRGPMKVPTDGTKVFSPVARTGTSATAIVTAGFTPDMLWGKKRSGTTQALAWDRLRGVGNNLILPSTAAESAAGAGVQLVSLDMNGLTLGTDSGFDQINGAIGDTFANWIFQRAPGFFDEVCYTGTSSATTQTHNLSVVPELIIVKRRDGASGFYWGVYAAPLGATKYLALNATIAAATSAGLWNNTTPTSSVFSLGTNNDVNLSAATYVAYLFATCAGVSKVGTYTGNGTTQTINCGFAAGARFVLIKRTDSTGDWYVYDTARGMTTLTDPYLLLNSTAAEVATLGSVTTVTTGFAVNAAVLAAINTNAASYVFLAIA